MRPPELLEHVPLAPYTTLNIGGPARYFIHALSEKTVSDALEFAHAERIPVFVLGGGSNLLVADSGFDGLVVRVAIGGMDWDIAGPGTCRVGAGVEWDAFVALAVQRGLGGIECLSGIPGTAGGTPVQNVGAYGQEVSDIIDGVGVIGRTSGVRHILANSECGFAYRSSIFNSTERDRHIVLDVTYRLRRDAPAGLRYPDLQKYFAESDRDPGVAEVREAVLQIRASKSMVLTAGDPNRRSAGSFFKNPVLTERQAEAIQSDLPEGQRMPQYPAAGGIKTSAAWLIERAGFHRGFGDGAAGLSTRHTLAIVNRGSASAVDVLTLAHQIQQRVHDTSGVWLMPEPVFVGFDAAATDLLTRPSLRQ